MLHEAIVAREEQGESLSRLLPGGVAAKLLAEGRGVGETERLVVTVVMSDILNGKLTDDDYDRFCDAAGRVLYVAEVAHV